jgi:hypothetical protein
MYLLNSYLGLSKIPLFSERKDKFLKYKINIFFIKNTWFFVILIKQRTQMYNNINLSINKKTTAL